MTIRKLFRENRLVIVQVALLLSARVSRLPDRDPPVHDHPWEVYPSGDPASSRVYVPAFTLWARHGR